MRVSSFIFNAFLLIIKLYFNIYLKNKSRKSENISTVVFDGIITQRLLDIASSKNIKEIVGIKIGNVIKMPTSVKVITKKDIE